LANHPSISILSAEQGSLWHGELEKSECQDVYFSPEYAHTFRAADGGVSRLFIYEDEDGRFLYPFRLLRLPPVKRLEEFEDWFDITSDYGYGGPLISYTQPDVSGREFAGKAVRAFDRYCAQQRVVAEFCRFHPLLSNAWDVKDEYRPVPCNQTVWIDLSLSVDELQRQMRKGFRYDIRRAEKQGVEIETGQAPAHADEFYGLYLRTMKDIGAREYYFFSRDFFRGILEFLAGQAIVFLARYRGQTIAAAIYIWGKQFLHYHFAAMDRDHAPIGASKLIQYRAIIWGKQRGFGKMHLGGGVGGSDSDSLMHFKTGFSPLRAEFCIAKRVHNPSVYQALSVAAGFNPDREPFFPAYRGIRYGEDLKTSKGKP